MVPYIGRMDTSIRSQRRGRVAFLLTAALLIGACGGVGSDGAADTTSSSAPAESTAPVTDPAASQPDAAPPATTDPDTVPDGGGTDEAAVGGDFCLMNEQVRQLMVDLMVSENPEQVYQEIERLVDQITAAAPPGLEADVATAAGFYAAARVALEAGGWDVVSVLESLPIDPAVEEAGERIDTYLETDCPS